MPDGFELLPPSDDPEAEAMRALSIASDELVLGLAATALNELVVYLSHQRPIAEQAAEYIARLDISQLHQAEVDKMAAPPASITTQPTDPARRYRFMSTGKSGWMTGEGFLWRFS